MGGPGPGHFAADKQQRSSSLGSYSQAPPQQPQKRRSLPSQIAQKRRNPGALVLGTPGKRLLITDRSG